jgi:hypothetical protein
MRLDSGTRSGRTPPRTPDAPSARERKEIARVHRGIERAQGEVRRRVRQQVSQPAPCSDLGRKGQGICKPPSSFDCRGSWQCRCTGSYAPLAARHRALEERRTGPWRCRLSLSEYRSRSRLGRAFTRNTYS